jgi:hypothetical protein
MREEEWPLATDVIAAVSPSPEDVRGTEVAFAISYKPQQFSPSGPSSGAWGWLVYARANWLALANGDYSVKDARGKAVACCVGDIRQGDDFRCRW